ncbi:unnamed protein product [Phaedon cochleariae]|uniref:Uncharacterized protein n=1 Tax=Phaedon cochleariae TaxID=80249 RepID=A0A9N9SGN0_PHACE|nr:unnamed protein product [Phaedon cochleariae]
MRDGEIEVFKEELVDLNCENDIDEIKDEEIDKFKTELVDLDNRNEVDKIRGEEIEGFKEESLDLDYENEIVQIKDEEIDNFKKELLDLDNSNKGDKTRDEEIEDFKEESVDLHYENKIDEIKDEENEMGDEEIEEFKEELVDLDYGNEVDEIKVEEIDKFRKESLLDLDNRNEGNEMRGEEIEEFKEELVDLDCENKIAEIKDEDFHNFKYEEIEIFKMELVDLDNRNEVDKMGDEEIEQFKKRLIDLDNKNEIDEMRDELIEEFDEKLVDLDDENNINRMKDKEMEDVEELERELENSENQNDIDKIRQENVEHFEKGLTDLHVHNEIHKMTEDGEEFKKELLDLGYENKIETIGDIQHAEVFQKKLVDQDFEKEEVSEEVFKDRAFIEYKIEIEETKVERELEHVGSKNGPEDLSASTKMGNIGVSTPKLVENEEEKNWIELKHIPILIQQMTQHVQILAQNFILTYNHPELHHSSAQIKEYLLNIKFLRDGKERSCFHTVNLSAALELVDYWEKLLATNNDDVKKMKLHIEETIAKCIHYHQSGTVFIVPFPALILETISNSSAIVYPSLLPKIPFKTPKVAYRVNNVVYTKSEDHLISLGLEQFMPVGLVTQKEKRYCKPRGLISVCDLIQAHMMTYRESVSIRNHINVMKHKKHSSNPIKYYFEFGKAPPYVHHLIPLGPSLPPCERSPEDLPYQWREYLNSQKENQEKDSSSCNVILVVGTLIS